MYAHVFCNRDCFYHVLSSMQAEILCKPQIIHLALRWNLLHPFGCRTRKLSSNKGEGLHEHNSSTDPSRVQCEMLVSNISFQAVVCYSRNGQGAQCKHLKLLTLKTTKIFVKIPFKVLHSLHLVTDMQYL